MTTAEERGCYCGLWDTSPATLEAQGVLRGFCGRCCVCGQPGHLRHFPGPVPLTNAWCDRHYRRTWLFNPRGSLGTLVWAGGAIALALLIASLVRRC
jgi:hypothetical protein